MCALCLQSAAETAPTLGTSFNIVFPSATSQLFDLCVKFLCYYGLVLNSGLFQQSLKYAHADLLLHSHAHSLSHILYEHPSEAASASKKTRTKSHFQMHGLSLTNSAPQGEKNALSPPAAPHPEFENSSLRSVSLEDAIEI